MQNTEFGDTWICLLNSMDFLLTKISHKEWWLPVRVPVFDDLQSFFNGISGLILENKIMMSQPDSQHLFLLLKRTVVMRIVWPYTWHPRGRCHCHICSIAFSVKLFDGQRGIFDRTEETLHGCPHHPGPLCSWNCLQHHSQILNHKCHYIYGRKICHWGFAFATPWLFPLHLFDRSLKICSLPLQVHVIVDIFLCGKILLACWRWHLIFQGRSQFEQILSSVSSSHQHQWHPCSSNHEFW